MSTPIIRLVVAYSSNRCIGKDNDLPWRLPKDLAHFKASTLGHPIIMGRKTWESIGKRALPGRPNAIISRQSDYVASGATVYTSLQQALDAFADQRVICVIGGEQIFSQSLACADEVIATEVHAHVEGDTFFPELSEDWVAVDRQPQPEENGYTYDFVTFRRKE